MGSAGTEPNSCKIRASSLARLSEDLVKLAERSVVKRSFRKSIEHFLYRALSTPTRSTDELMDQINGMSV